MNLTVFRKKENRRLMDFFLFVKDRLPGGGTGVECSHEGWLSAYKAYCYGRLQGKTDAEIEEDLSHILGGWFMPKIELEVE